GLPASDEAPGWISPCHLPARTIRWLSERLAGCMAPGRTMYLHYTQQHADVKKKSNSATSWMQPDGSARGGFEERLFHRKFIHRSKVRPVFAPYRQAHRSGNHSIINLCPIVALAVRSTLPGQAPLQGQAIEGAQNKKM